jgi:hypothetical protein
MNCVAVHCDCNRDGECAIFVLESPGPCREFELREGAECQHKRAVGRRYHGPYGLELCPECLSTRKFCDTTTWNNGQAFNIYVEHGPWRPFPQGWAELEAVFGPETVSEMLGIRSKSEHCPHI